MPVHARVSGEGAKRVTRGTTIVYEKWVKTQGSPAPGVLVELETREGSVACGLWDGQGPVAVRVVYPGVCEFNSPRELIGWALEGALRARERSRVLGWDAYRLVNSDGDRLSGLIVDVYKDVAVIQSSSLAVDVHLDYIVDWLVENTGVKWVFEKSIQRSRREIGLEPRSRWLTGGGPERLVVEEDGVKFVVDVVHGQKTGLFLDQRENRVEFGRYTGPGDVILDVFSYTGGFGLHGLFSGSSHVVFVEEDPWATRAIVENLRLNGIPSSRATIVNDTVWRFARRGETLPMSGFTVSSVDPPAFIQRGDRESVRKGFLAYLDSYRWVAGQVADGLLYLSSCSYFLNRERFLRVVAEALRGRAFRILGSLRGASRDHVYGGEEYLEYLKGAFIAL